MGKVGAAVRYLMLIKPLSWMHGAHDGRAITAHGIRVGNKSVNEIELQEHNEIC